MAAAAVFDFGRGGIACRPFQFNSELARKIDSPRRRRRRVFACYFRRDNDALEVRRVAGNEGYKKKWDVKTRVGYTVSQPRNPMQAWPHVGG